MPNIIHPLGFCDPSRSDPHNERTASSLGGMSTTWEGGRSIQARGVSHLRWRCWRRGGTGRCGAWRPPSSPTAPPAATRGRACRRRPSRRGADWKIAVDGGAARRLRRRRLLLGAWYLLHRRVVLYVAVQHDQMHDIPRRWGDGPCWPCLGWILDLKEISSLQVPSVEGEFEKRRWSTLSDTTRP